jgi:hypothetical protein
LAPTNFQVDSYNTSILQSIDGTGQIYLAADSLKEVGDLGLTAPDSILDYVAKYPPPGLPPHSLTIKSNAVFRLLRNLSVDRGLVKNVRVVIVHTGTRLITVRLLKGIAGTINHIDEEDILIPRINFTSTLPSGHTLLRRQFPLAPAYATTFNSCQGLTLTFSELISLALSSHMDNSTLLYREFATDHMQKFAYDPVKVQLQM